MSNWTKLRIAVGKAILPDAEPGSLHKSSSSTKVNDRTFQYVQDQRNLTGTEIKSTSLFVKLSLTQKRERRYTRALYKPTHSKPANLVRV